MECIVALVKTSKEFHPVLIFTPLEDLVFRSENNSREFKKAGSWRRRSWHEIRKRKRLFRSSPLPENVRYHKSSSQWMLLSYNIWHKRMSYVYLVHSLDASPFLLACRLRAAVCSRSSLAHSNASCLVPKFLFAHLWILASTQPLRRVELF